MPEHRNDFYGPIVARTESEILQVALFDLVEHAENYAAVPLVPKACRAALTEGGAHYEPRGVSFVCIEESEEGGKLSVEVVPPEDTEPQPFVETCRELVAPLAFPEIPVNLTKFLARMVKCTPVVAGVTFLDDGKDRAFAMLHVPLFYMQEGFEIINSHPEYVPQTMDMVNRVPFSRGAAATIYDFVHRKLDQLL